MEFTHLINEEVNKIFVYDENGVRVGFGDLMSDYYNCDKFSVVYLNNARKEYQKNSVKYAQLWKSHYAKEVEQYQKHFFESLQKFQEFESLEQQLEKNKPVKTQSFLDKAKQLYPVGTTIVSLFGAKDEVIELNGMPTHFWDDDGTSILVRCKKEIRLVFDFAINDNWAKVSVTPF